MQQDFCCTAREKPLCRNLTCPFHVGQMCWYEADEQIMVKYLLILSIKEITYMEEIRR